VNIDECAGALADCDVHAICTDTAPGYECRCDAAAFYIGDGNTCDFDECSAGEASCPANSTCINTYGSYTCACNPGFEELGESCTNINECARDLDECAEHAQCGDLPGSYSCECNEGFEGDGFACDDIDECVRRLDDCDANAACTNSPGAYECSCLPGFAGDGSLCEPDLDTYVADVSDRPIPIAIGDLGDFTITGLSRIGWDIEVISTMVDPDRGRIKQDAGLITYPDITMRHVTGGDTAVAALSSWLASDPATAPSKDLVVSLQGLGGERAVLRLVAVRPTAGCNLAITTQGPQATLQQMVLAVDGAIELQFYQGHQSFYPMPLYPCTFLEISGISPDVYAGENRCYTEGNLVVPTPGTCEPVLLQNVHVGSTYFDYMVSTTNYVINDGNAIDRRAASFVGLAAAYDEIPGSRINIYELWPSRIHLFNPLKAYGYTYLFDLVIVYELAEEA
jgi:hypothetical protein